MEKTVPPEFWEKLVLQGMDVITVLDRKGVILFDTPSVAVFGYKWKENVGKNIFDFIHPDDVPYLRRIYREGMRREGATAFAEIRFKHKDGSWRYVQSMAKNLLHDPAVRGIMVNTRDNTERRKAEVLYRTLFEQSPDAVVLYDPEADCPVMFNDVLPRLLGYSRLEFSRLHIRDIALHTNRARIIRRKKHTLRKGFYTFDSAVRTKDGEEKIAHVLVKTVELSGRKYFHAIFRDITEQKAAERKMNDYQDMLRRMAAELSLTQEKERKRIANELHDHLSQNLSLCKINLQHLRERLAGRETKQAIREVECCLEGSLRYSRTLTAELSPLVLYELGFEPAVAWLAENIGEKYGVGISVSGHIRRSGGKKSIPDETTRIVLFQTVRELLLNVVRHARARHAWVFISGDSRGIRVTVRDDGVGFDVSACRPDRRKCCYGLFAVRERLATLGGSLSIDSLPGKGTRAVLSAPLGKPARRVS